MRRFLLNKMEIEKRNIIVSRMMVLGTVVDNLLCDRLGVGGYI